MLPDRDKSAVFALLVRQVIAQEQARMAQATIDEAKATLTASTVSRTNIRTALSVFGFDMTIEKPWDSIRDALGLETYVKAIRLGEKIAAQGEDRAKGLPYEAKSAEESAIQSESGSGVSEDDEGESSDEDSDRIGGAVSSPPKIRELIIEKLQAAGDTGAKVGEIKDFVALSGVEMHEKTVGMTLYRLAKEDIARREGRTWFYVPRTKGSQPIDSMFS